LIFSAIIVFSFFTAKPEVLLCGAIRHKADQESSMQIQEGSVIEPERH
jgi:hypothetical protein